MVHDIKIQYMYTCKLILSLRTPGGCLQQRLLSTSQKRGYLPAYSGCPLLGPTSALVSAQWSRYYSLVVPDGTCPRCASFDRLKLVGTLWTALQCCRCRWWLLVQSRHVHMVFETGYSRICVRSWWYILNLSTVTCTLNLLTIMRQSIAVWPWKLLERCWR